jgi:predicted glycoside hydrolase/deacetylase ChbG (UPF0249 family)
VTRLVLNADDAGLAAGLSQRIASLLASGRLGGTSLLACGEAFDDAVRALREAGVGEAGVHLCLVGGEAPLSPPQRVRGIAPGGRFPRSWPAVAVRVASGLAPVAEVEREWEAQVVAVRSTGFRVTHLDAHQHLHLLPRLVPVAAALARRFDVPFVRAPRGDDPAATADPGIGGRSRARLLALFGASARKVLARAGLPEAPRVLGLAEAGRMHLARWRTLLDALPSEGTFEVVLHPGVEDARARLRYPWGYSWEEEATALEDDGLSERMSARGVARVGFGELARS